MLSSICTENVKADYEGCDSQITVKTLEGKVIADYCERCKFGYYAVSWAEEMKAEKGLIGNYFFCKKVSSSIN